MLPIYFVLVLLAPLLQFFARPATSNATQPQEPPTALDLISCLGPQYELVYEINGLNTDYNFRVSFLARETSSLSHRRGRILLHSHLDSTEDVLHYWSSSATHRQLLWIKPFSCTQQVQTLKSLDGSAALEIILTNYFNQLSFYKNERGDYSGLSGILLNLLNHETSLRKLKKLDANNFLVSLISQNHVFRLIWPQGAKSKCEQVSGLQLKLSRQGKTIIHITMLSLSSPKNLEEIRPPLAYGCPRDIQDKVSPLPEIVPKIAPNDPIHMYLRVGVVHGSQAHLNATPNRPIDPLRPIEPIDTVDGVGYVASIKTFSLVVDHLQHLVAMHHDDKLDVWDLNSWHKFQVTEGGTSCNRAPIYLKASTMFGLDTSHRVKTCKDEGIELDLGDDLNLRLNQDSVLFLTGQLSLNQDGIVYSDVDELVHVRSFKELNTKLCLFRKDKDGETLVNVESATVIRRYRALGGNRYKLMMTTLLVYQKANTSQVQQLELRLNFELLNLNPYKTFRGTPKNFIDLSACVTGLNMFIEYELSQNTRLQIKRTSMGIRETIRTSVANYLYRRHLVPFTRVPSIDIQPLDDDSPTMTVHVRILDKLLPTRDAVSLTEYTNFESMSYEDLIKSSHMSKMVGSLQECAEYCDYHNCHSYIFCKYLLSCHLYFAFYVGSLRNMEHHCEAFKVIDNSQETNAQWWRDHSPNLAKLADDIVSEIECNRGPILDFVVPVGPREKAFYQQQVRIIPRLAYYRHNDRFDQSRSELSQFTIEHGANKLEPTAEVRLNHDEVLVDLDADSLGYLIFYHEFDAGDCARLCLSEPNCNAFSHCPNLGECLITKFDGQNQKDADYGSGGVLKLKEESECSILRRDQLSKFEPLGDRMLSINDYVPDPLAKVLDAEGCAIQCLPGDCQYFDFCSKFVEGKDDRQNFCIKYNNESIENARNTDLEENDDSNSTSDNISSAAFFKCIRYIPNHLNMFEKIPSKELRIYSTQFKEDLTYMSGLSLSKCSHLCDIDENCGAFEWCSTRQYELSMISCSLGTNETLQMSASEMVAYSYKNSKDSLVVPSSRCSVYAYRKGTKRLESKRKKKWTGSIERPLLVLESPRILSLLKSLRLDLILLVMSFLLAFVVHDKPLAGLPLLFRRMKKSNDPELPLESLSRSKISDCIELDQGHDELTEAASSNTNKDITDC